MPASSRKAPSKIVVKMAIDAVMALVLALLYNAHVLTLTFHEVAGLAVAAIMLVHVLTSRSWVVRMAKRLFGKGVPARTKFSYCMSAVLAVLFVLIVVSGVLISSVLFPALNAAVGPAKGTWHTVHLFCSALSLIVIGIHLGLHWDIVKAFCRKRLSLPDAISKPLCVVAIIAMVAWGAYSFVPSGFEHWITLPFIPATGGKPEGVVETIDIAGALFAVTQYASITGIFAAITYGIDRLTKKATVVNRKRAAQNN